MVRRKKTRYRLSFNSAQLNAAVTLLGVSFFLKMVYYLGFVGLSDCGAGTLILNLVLPGLIELALIVLLRGIQFNLPILYSFTGATYALLLLIQSFWIGSALEMVFMIIFCLACAALLVLGELGIVKMWIAGVVCFSTAGLKLLLFDLFPYIFSLRLVALLPQAAVICALAAFGALALAYKPVRKRRQNTESLSL